MDPVFTAHSVDTTPPTVAVESPAPGATGVTTLVTPKATYNEPVQPGTVSFVLTKAGNPVPANVSYDAASRTSRLAPLSPLSTSTLYTATVSGATDLAGNVIAPPATWTFTTSATAPPPLISLWNPSATPANPSVDDPNAVELGVKFQSDIAGSVTGVRFYKGVGNTGTHTGNLWTADGTLLSSVVFTNETASGWQEMSFPSPVVIAADTTYVVSYYAPDGHYAADGSYFAASGSTTRHCTVSPIPSRRTACSTTAPAASRPVPSTRATTGSTWCWPPARSTTRRPRWRRPCPRRARSRSRRLHRVGHVQ